MSTKDETADLGPICQVCGGDLPEPGAACPRCSVTRAAAPADEAAGFTGPKRIAGYRVLREIGSGGMGAVFEAYEDGMHRKVALKVLSRHHGPSEKADERFEREAWIGGKLDHPNIVKVYERGAWEELSFYSMELVEGGSLHEVILNMKRWGRDDRLGLDFGTREYVEWAINRTIEAARGLEHAHRHRVVHRDVKPMNLLLSSELGTVKVADFGLAVDEEASRLTTTGRVLGTLVYMAPEQILGKREEVGPATDVFALGVTLFELLTLEYPFVGDTRELYLNAALTSEARRPSKLNERVSRDLEIVIGKALEKRPRDRYPGAAAFAEDLENVLWFRPIRARPPRWPARIAKWVRRKPVHAALLATLIVAAPTTAFLAHRALEQRRLAREARVVELWNELRQLNLRRDHQAMLDGVREILALDPEDVLALRARALNAMELALAAEGPDEGRSFVSESLDALKRLEEVVPEAAWPHRLRAYILNRLGRKEEARIATVVAEAHRSDQTGDDDLLFDAKLAAYAGDHGRAVDLYSRLIARRPGRRGAIVGRAMSRDALGDTEGAVRDLEWAASLNPDDPVTRLRLGRLLVQQGRLDEAGEHLRAALSLSPDDAVVQQGLAALALERGRRAAAGGETERALGLFREAESAARKSLELGELPFTHADLGASLNEQYRLQKTPDRRLIDEAIEHYEREIALWREEDRDDEVYAVTLSNLCDAYLQLGKLEKGLDSCRRAAELSPNDPVDQYNLAGAYALLGRADESLAALERDFELGDRDHEVLAADPWFVSLREDPRFLDLLERMRRDPR